jgi:hypothetical protein
MNFINITGGKKKHKFRTAICVLRLQYRSLRKVCSLNFYLENNIDLQRSKRLLIGGSSRCDI